MNVLGPMRFALVPLALSLAHCNTAPKSPAPATTPTSPVVGTGADGTVSVPGGETPAVPGAAQDANVTPIAVNAAAFKGMLGGPDNAYTLVGRFDTTVPTAIRFSLPNSKLGATFTGDSLGLMLAGNGYDSLSVVIDNAPPRVITTLPATALTLYPVATGLGEGPHTAWIIKRTEGAQQSQIDPTQRTGTLTFGGFVLAAGASMGAPPAPKSHLIVTVGDSGFTGYGIGQLEAEGTKCVYSPATQDATLAVPAKLAALVGAEVINVSASGKGVAASAYDAAGGNNQLPALWQMTVPPNRTPAYDFPPLPVDVVVLEGGANDLVGDYGKGAFADVNVFVAKFTEFLAEFRARYPSAIIVAVINPNAIQTDKTNLTQTITQAVAARTAAGDTRVFVFDYFAQDPQGWVSYTDASKALALGHGCQGHPSEAGANFLAARLAAFLQTHAPASP